MRFGPVLVATAAALALLDITPADATDIETIQQIIGMALTS
jgi:hypothetical protein